MARPKKAPAPPPKPPKTPSFVPTHPKQRSAHGKFVGKDALWKTNDPDGFWAWLADIKPRVITKGGKYEPWSPTDRQKLTINQMLASDGKGGFLRSIGLLIWPRRHGKSTMMALIVLWLSTSRENFTVQLQGNTESISRKAQFNTLVNVIEHTPELRKLIDPDKDISKFEISYPKKGNVIQGMTGNNVASAFGDRLNVLWVSDLHACPDLSSFNAMQASMLDSENTLLLIDSNVDAFDGHVHRLQKEADKDAAIYCNHLWYLDFCHYEAAAPLWIDRPKAQRLKKILLEAGFDRDILGRRTQAQNALFEQAHIEKCKTKYQVPVMKDFRELVQGRSVKIGAGLDRAKSLLGTASGGDNTIFSVVAKVARHDGEPEIFLLDQVKVVPNTAQHIKKLIRDAHDRYKLDNFTIEDYQAMDIEPWCIEQNIPVELVAASSNRQNAMFPELYRIVKEGRLHFPGDLEDLAAEMAGFQYTTLRDGKYSFGAAGHGHDDRVYSLGWAIYSLRQEVMAVYTLGNIQCAAKGRIRPFCMLLGGDQELTCSGSCHAFQQVKDMHREFKKFHTESAFDVCQFYKRYVRVTGSLIVQAA